MYVRVHSPVYSKDDDQTTFLAQILVPNSSKSKTIRSLSKKKRKDSKGINKGLLSNGIDGIFRNMAVPVVEGVEYRQQRRGFVPVGIDQSQIGCFDFDVVGYEHRVLRGMG